MDAVDENTVWAVGVGEDYSGDVWGVNASDGFTTTSDGGATWTTGALPFPADAPWVGFQISGIDENNAWVAGTNFWGGGAIYKTSDGGMTWIKQDVFDEAESFAVVVRFWDENSGIAIGDPLDGYFEIHTTDDGGENWMRVPTENIPVPVTSEYAVTSTYAVLEDHIWFGTGVGRVFHSAYKGQNWTAATT